MNQGQNLKFKDQDQKVKVCQVLMINQDKIVKMIVAQYVDKGFQQFKN